MLEKGRRTWNSAGPKFSPRLGGWVRRNEEIYFLSFQEFTGRTQLSGQQQNEGFASAPSSAGEGLEQRVWSSRRRRREGVSEAGQELGIQNVQKRGGGAVGE